MREVIYTETPETICPECNVKLDAITGDRKPAEGDLSICVHCFAVLVIREDLTVRKMTPKEWAALSTEAQMYISFARFQIRMDRFYTQIQNN